MGPGQNTSNDLTADSRNAIATSSGLKVRRAARRITHFLEQLTVGAGLSVAQFDLMVHVAAAPVSNLSQLAARMGLNQTTLSRNLRGLEDRRLVALARGEADRRLRSVSLTEVGRERLRAALPIWRGAQDSLACLVEPKLVNALEAATELLALDGDASPASEINPDRKRGHNCAAQLAPRGVRRGLG
jgi:DNA-binding MarR family transcriptional regulator